MRSLFTGHITFGLITIPVGVFSAVESSERVGFRLFHRKDMAPIRYKKFCSEEDVEVDNQEIVKGYEVEKKRFAAVEKQELDKVSEEVGGRDHSIEVLQFVDVASLNPLSFEKPYYLAPGKGGEKAYAVLRDALMDSRRVGIARVTLRSKPSLAALIPGERALAMEVLRPFEELRDPKDLAVPSAKATAAELKMARLLVDQMSTEGWDPTQHPNEYRAALKKLLARKKTFGTPARAAEAGDGEVVDLMAALKASLGKKGAKPAGRMPPKRAPRTAAAVRVPAARAKKTTRRAKAA